MPFPRSKCRYCPKEVIWIELPDGTRTCVDPSAPTYFVTRDGDRIIGTRADLSSEEPVLVSHFKTCSGVNKVKEDQAKKKSSAD